jgi:hypothetical protein
MLELYGDDALSYSEVCHGSRQFLMGREYVEDASRTSQPPISVFGFKLRVHSRRCHFPLFDALPRPQTPTTTVFYILTEVLGLRFRYWRWVV